MPNITTLHEAEAVLEPYIPSRLKRFAYTTEHMQHFMEYIGNPQNVPSAIHIAGTSGKTSTAHYTAALLQQSGKKVGLLTSPHMESINERVQINRRPLPEKEFCSELSVFLDLVKKSGITLTYAEILYAFAYWEFARQHVDYIVVEVGMGGLLDATNVISRHDKVCILTDIGLDHTNVLGGTIEEITRHKAGIIGLHNTVFCYRQGRAVMGEIQKTCHQKQADLHIAGNSSPGNFPFLPIFQRRNVALATETVQFVLSRDGSGRLNTQQQLEAAHSYIPGRMEIVPFGGKTIVFDGAHNTQKLQALKSSVQDYFPDTDIAVLFAVTGGRGRILEEMMTAFAALPSHLIVTSIQQTGHHAASIEPQLVADIARRIGVPDVECIPDQLKACKALLARPEPVLLCTGSVYLIGQVRRRIMQAASRPSLQ